LFILKKDGVKIDKSCEPESESDYDDEFLLISADYK